MKNNTQRKQEHTHVKNLKRQLMTKDFLWRLKLHVGNWNEWPLVLSTWLKGEVDEGRWKMTSSYKTDQVYVVSYVVTGSVSCE